jgi:hypothetical protein
MKRKARKERNTWLWIWIVVGLVAGFVAFGPLGAILGVIGGLYIGNNIVKERRKVKR